MYFVVRSMTYLIENSLPEVCWLAKSEVVQNNLEPSTYFGTGHEVHEKFHFAVIYFIHCFSIDSSDYMRNGDFLPTRLQAQQEAVNLLSIAKLRSNPENNIGLLKMAKWVLPLVSTLDLNYHSCQMYHEPLCFCVLVIWKILQPTDP